MRPVVISLSFILFFCLIGCSPSVEDAKPGSPPQAKPADRANEIISEYIKRDAAPFRKERVRFTIRAEGEPVEIYELDVWRRQKGTQTETLSLIVKPEDDAGSGALAIESDGKPTVNTTYSQSRDEFRETDTGKMFFGGLTAQELLGEWTKYDFKFVGDRDVDGMKAVEIEGKLKDGQTSAIASNKVVIDTQDHLLLEVHLFDNTGKELRSYNYKDIKSANGRRYVAKTEAVNHVYNSRITIEILSREYPAAIDDSMFTREKLKASVRK